MTAIKQLAGYLICYGVFAFAPWDTADAFSGRLASDTHGEQTNAVPRPASSSPRGSAFTRRVGQSPASGRRRRPTRA